MKYYELQNSLIDEALEHKQLVERVADETLEQALLIPNFKSKYIELKDRKRALANSENLAKYSEKNDVCIALLQQQLFEIAKDNNISKTDFVPKYWCKKCKDTGLIGDKVCDCIAHRIVDRMRGEESIRKLATFDKCDMKVYNKDPYIIAAYDKAKEFVDKIDTTKYNNITIIGTVGSGKTYLMECMASRAIEMGKEVMLLSAFRLNQAFLDYHTSPIREKNAIIEPFLKCDMLCIDDLGCEQLLNNVTIPMLTMLINERNLSNKKTVITSNLSIDEIRERYDYRLCSRLVDSQLSLIMEINYQDLRQHKNI